jgi:hypothetical protein
MQIVNEKKRKVVSKRARGTEAKEVGLCKPLFICIE